MQAWEAASMSLILNAVPLEGYALCETIFMCYNKHRN